MILKENELLQMRRFNVLITCQSCQYSFEILVREVRHLVKNNFVKFPVCFVLNFKSLQSVLSGGLRD